MRRFPGAAILLLLACGPALPAAADAAGEVTVFGAAAAGDYGTGLESDAQWLILRYVTGSDLQFRVDLSVVRVGALSGISFTGLGPVPAGRGRWQGPHDGDLADSAGDPASSPVLAGERSAGLGDVYVAASRRVVGGGARLFRLDANVEVKVPTADEDENLGTGEWDYRLGLGGEYRFWSVTAFGGLGWTRLGDPAWVDLHDGADVFLGLDGNPVARERLIVGGWVEGWEEVVDSVGHRVALGFGVRTTGRVRWRLQVRRGLTDAAPDLAVALGASFGISPPGPGTRGPRQ